MSISFNYIPAGNTLLTPLFFGEVDNSQAGYSSTSLKTLLIAQKLSTGTATANIPFAAANQVSVETLTGVGSMAARMYKTFRQTNIGGEVWILPLDENASGVKQAGTITVTGPATAAGTINLYIAGQLVQAAVGSTDDATAIATVIKNVINAATDLPVTATSALGVVTWTCRWKGATGVDIQVTDSYKGHAGGESLPTGVALAYAYTVTGTSNPSLTAAITGMGDDQYDFIIHPFTDSTSLAALAAELGDVTGRWSYARMIYGHGYTALRDTYGNLITAGGAQPNDQHHTIAAIDADTQAPAWEYAAAYGAANAVGLSADIARPTQTLPLVGIMAPRRGMSFMKTERNALLSYGIATSYVEGGVVRVERAVTTYKKNALGVSDLSYLDSEDLHKLAYIMRRLRSAVTSKYARHALANDGTRFGPGKAIVTPKVVRGELIAEYRDMEYAGVVENHEAFEQYLIVERNADNPNRLDVLYPPDLTNALRIFAVLNQFRLQYPTAVV